MQSMQAPSATATVLPAFVLRFTDLFDRGRGFAFPCDAQGHVDMESLSDRALNNYLFARALVGKHLSLPAVMPAD